MEHDAGRKDAAALGCKLDVDDEVIAFDGLVAIDRAMQAERP
jgi:hypothetical protein